MFVCEEMGAGCKPLAKKMVLGLHADCNKCKRRVPCSECGTSKQLSVCILFPSSLVLKETVLRREQDVPCFNKTHQWITIEN